MGSRRSNQPLQERETGVIRIAGKGGYNYKALGAKRLVLYNAFLIKSRLEGGTQCAKLNGLSEGNQHSYFEHFSKTSQEN